MTLGAALLLIVLFVSVLGMWAYTSTVMSYWSPKFEDTIWNMIYRPVLVLTLGRLLHIHIS